MRAICHASRSPAVQPFDVCWGWMSPQLFISCSYPDMCTGECTGSVDESIGLGEEVLMAFVVCICNAIKNGSSLE